MRFSLLMGLFIVFLCSSCKKDAYDTMKIRLRKSNWYLRELKHYTYNDSTNQLLYNYSDPTNNCSDNTIYEFKSGGKVTMKVPCNSPKSFYEGTWTLTEDSILSYDILYEIIDMGNARTFHLGFQNAKVLELNMDAFRLTDKNPLILYSFDSTGKRTVIRQQYIATFAAK